MELLKNEPNRLENIYKLYNTNEIEIKEYVRILKEWILKQPHLPKKLPYDGFLERMLKNNKYRIERTKERIDSYFTLKALNLYIFQELANKNSIGPFLSSAEFGFSPIFHENEQNLFFGFFKSPNPDLFDFDKYLQSILALCEVALRHNNATSIRCVFDLANVSLGLFKKINFLKYRNVMKLILDGYGFQISGVDFLNLPIYCYPIITLLKSVSSTKMVARIKIHDNFDSLHKEVPKHLLPEQLGGTAKFTLNELAASSELILQNQASFFADSVNYVSNEKLRIGKSKYNDMFGIDGTFKQLNVD